jgi:hypothetical protein
VCVLYAYAYVTTPSILLHTNPLSCSKRKERRRRRRSSAGSAGPPKISKHAIGVEFSHPSQCIPLTMDEIKELDAKLTKTPCQKQP